MSALSGCLSLPLLPLRVLGLVGPAPRQITAVALQNVRWDRLDEEDRPAIRRARASAEGCLASLSVGRRELGTASDDVGAEVVKLFGRICAVAEELARARKFVRENDGDAIARQRADTEVKSLGAKMAERTANDATLQALEERAKHAATVAGEVGVMNARLMAAVASLETLNTRLSRSALSTEERSARVEGVLDELQAQHADAERALQAYAATAREISRLGG